MFENFEEFRNRRMPGWVIPVLIAAGWWRHIRCRIPMRYDATFWSLVFPLGMYAVAGIYLGRADGLPVVEAIGRGELWVAFAVWMVVFVAMTRHVANTVFRSTPLVTPQEVTGSR